MIFSSVTPLVGVWIEIHGICSETVRCFVTPLVGVWIEIIPSDHLKEYQRVTPLVGVWIEIDYIPCIAWGRYGHSPCGSVD